MLLHHAKSPNDFSRIHISDCVGHAEISPNLFSRVTPATKLVIDDHKDKVRSVIWADIQDNKLLDYNKYPDLWMRSSFYIPYTETTKQTGFTIFRGPWEWWRDKNGDAWNFRTGCYLQVRDGGARRWFTFNAMLERVADGSNPDVVMKAVDYFKPWAYETWFTVTFHVHRREDTGGYVEVFVDDDLAVAPRYGRTAYNSRHVSSVAFYVCRPQFYISRDTNPMIGGAHLYIDDAQVSTERLPLADHGLLVLSSTAGGTTEPPAGNYYLDLNDTMSIKALPEDGYKFVHWLSDSAIYSGSNPLSFKMLVPASVTLIYLKAVFEEIAPAPECMLDTDCGPGLICVGGKCVPKDGAKPCTFHSLTTGTALHGLEPSLRALRDRRLPPRLTADYYFVSKYLAPKTQQLRAFSKRLLKLIL